MTMTMGGRLTSPHDHDQWGRSTSPHDHDQWVQGDPHDHDQWGEVNLPPMTMTSGGG